MAVKFANNVSTALSAAINATQTTISVADASGLPTLSSGDYVYLTIDTDTASPTREVVKVTAVSSNDLTVVRGQDDTTASSFSSGTKVELRVTAASLSDISSAADTESVSIAGDTMTGNLTVPSLNSGAITSSASVIASGNSNSFGNTTISALAVTSVTASGSITASGNSNSFGNTTVGTLTSGGITTSSHIDFTATTSLIRNQQDNSGQIGIQVKNSGGTVREVRWDAGNNSNGAWRPTSNGGADLGLTNKIWNNLFVNTLKMGTGNVEVIDSGRNISAAAVTGSSFTTTGTRVVNIANSTLTMKGDTGGWAFGLHALGSSNTNHGGFGFFGVADALSYFYIGESYNHATNFRFYKSGILTHGTTTIIDASRNFFPNGITTTSGVTIGGNLTTAGGITSSGHITMTSNGHSVNTRSIFARDTNGLNLGSTNGSTAISIDNSANVSMPNNLTVSGNLSVLGTTTTLNTATLDVEDKNITLNYGTGDTSGSANGAGITIQDAVNGSTDATILWDASSDRFEFSNGVDVENGGTVRVYRSGNSAYGELRFDTGENLDLFSSWGNKYLRLTRDGHLQLSGTTRIAHNGDATLGAITSSGSITATKLIDADNSSAYVDPNGASVLLGSLLSKGHSSGDNWMPYTDGNFYIRAPNTFLNGVVRSTNNANADGPNFNVSTTNKDTAEYAYRVDRSGTVVGGIRIDGRVNGQTVEVGGTTVLSSGRNLQNVVNATITGTATVPYVRVTGTGDASLSSTTHGIQVGETSGQNLLLDNNEVLSRNNGAASTLHLQADGGTVTVGAGTTANLTVSGSTTAGPIIATGAGTTNTTNALTVRRGNNADAFTVRDDGVVLVQQHYLYVNNTGGFYSLGAIRARGGITNDGGNPLSISSGASHINFNSKHLESVGNVQANLYRVGTTTVIDTNRNLVNIVGLYGNGGTLNHYNTNHVFKSTTSNLQAHLTDTGLGIGTSPSNAVLETVSSTGGGAPVFRAGSADFLGVLIGTQGGGFSVESNNYFAIWHQPYANKGTQNNLTERLRVSDSGNVGIGTGGDPAFTTGSGLEIQRAGAATLRLEDTGSGGKPFEIYSDDGEGYVVNGIGSGMPMIFKTVNAERLRIDTSGNINAKTGSFQIDGISVIDTGRKLTNITGGYFTGNVGIGVNNPNDKLSVMGSFHVGLNTSVTGRGLKVSTSNDQITDDLVTLNAQAATGVLRFDTAGNEAGRFDASRNFLVGKDANNTFNEGFVAKAGGGANITSAGGTTLELNRRSSDGTVLNFRKDNSTFGSVGVINGDNLRIGGSVADHAGLQFALHEIVPMEANVDSDGTIDLGSLNSNFKDLHLTGKAYFSNDGDQYISGNAASNYLSLYAANQERLRIDSSGNINAKTGSFQINGTTVINSSRNMTNIGSITSTGVIQATNSSGSNGTTTSQYAVIGLSSGGAQATIGSQHNGDGYANLNLGSIVSGDRKMWHISKRVNSLSNRLEFFWYESGGFNSRFQFSTGGNFTATGNIIGAGINSTATFTELGTTSGSSLVFKRNNASYIQADQTGGNFIFITNGRSTSYANRALAITTDNHLKAGGHVDAVSGFLVNGTSVIDSSRKLVNSTGATIAHNQHQGVKITGTDSSANTSFTSMLIDHNASGSTALTADRTHIALQIDMDSSATGGNTSDEHRLYGIHNYVKATGDSDIIYGIYSIAEAEQTAGQVSSLIGVYGQATTDAVAGQISNSYGVYGFNSLIASSGTTITNGYALYGKALVGAGQDSNISSVHGLYAEVEIDASGAGTTVSTVYGVRVEIDNDAGSADTTISNGYLFYGNYAGDLPTSRYGVYIADAVRNYFAGNITTGDGSTGTAAYGFNGDTNTGMYSPANHQLGFLVNGTERLLLTGSGATVTGDATLGSATTNARLVIQKADDNVPDHIKIFCGSTQTGEIGSMDTTWLRINQSINKNIYTPRYIRADSGFFVDNASMGIDGSGRLRAFAGSTSSVGIGFVNDIDTGFYRPSANTIDVVTAGDAHARFDSTGNLIVEGNVTAFGSVSDIRLKENIERIADPVKKVKQLDGVTFNYKKTGVKSTGLIAQQLLEVLPEVVYEETDIESGERHYALRYGQVVGLLVEAMKEQQDQIDSLKSIIEEMRNGNN